MDLRYFGSMGGCLTGQGRPLPYTCMLLVTPEHHGFPINSKTCPSLRSGEEGREDRHLPCSEQPSKATTGQDVL